MIYIDPPYNTGKEFVYNDTFDFSDEKLKNMLGLTDTEIKRLHSINGRSSHSAWLTFMYPRLKLARTLLKDSGVMFISIDDNEQSNLKLLCDEIFGEGNFICNFIWQTKKAAQGMTTENMVVNNHEYILVYAKDHSMFRFIGKERDANNGFSNPDNDPRGLWKRQYLQRLGQGLPVRTIVDPKNGNTFSFETPYTQEKLNNWILDNRIIFPETTENYPARKEFLNEYEHLQQLVTSLGLYATKSTTEQLYNLFDGKKIFDNPKPNTLIYDILKYTLGENKSSLILDFFAGSGTTAHAVMQLNAEDGGNRRWILCNIDEPTPADSEARKAGYTTIDAITVERIKRAAEHIGDASGFKRYSVKEPAEQTLNKIEAFDPEQNVLIPDDMVAAMGGAEVILYTWMVADGYKLDSTMQEKMIAGYTAYYDTNAMVYLIHQGWGKEQTKTLLNLIGTNQLNVRTIICYGYSFTLESMRELEINVQQSLNNQVVIEKRY